jgi:SpoVK/Ycf46/Vps4 family AAA+-type ATPase
VSVDPSVIQALQAAADADPKNPHLRLHLATTLLDAGRYEDALAACQQVMALAPDNVDALRVAARAAAAAGHDEQAAAYERLLTGLAPASPADPVAVSADGGSAPADEFDVFLREVLEEDARNRITLADVGGLTDVKRRIQTSFLGPLANPELRVMYGTSLRGGLLLYGPPGCGKTFLARAVAGELGAHFIAVGLHDVLDMWLGSSEKNLHRIFEEARRLAPVVLFFDEVDALGMKRSNLSQSVGRNVVAQLLAELDSIKDDNTGLFVLGATNAPWDIDPALRRPGRFDRTMLVLPPDLEARRAILAYHLKHRPVGTVDLEAIAKVTDGYSGADLRLLCDSAAEVALADSVTRGTARPIGQDDLRASVKEARPSTRAWFEMARNFATFANQDGEYDDLLAYMRAQRLV